MDNKTDLIRPDHIDRWGLLQEENAQLRADLRDAAEAFKKLQDYINKSYPIRGSIYPSTIISDFLNRPSIKGLMKGNP